ncbi:MAG: DegT/DnrJ/EryC1/StrS family aminotransferase [Acidobacteriota bacterium]
MTMILQSDPKASYLAHQAAIDAALQETLASGWYILGQQVQTFEQEFAAYLGAANCIGVANGTDALVLALRACNVGAGDWVITVAHTAVATVAAIELTGAIPLLVDIDPATFTIDPVQTEEAIRLHAGKVKAIIAVHLYGHPAAMTTLLEIAQRYDIKIIEDCAQAHGAQFQNRAVGVWADIAAFSFYPTKNLGALGDGGAVVTNDAALAERVRLLREYGWRERYISEITGMNSRLDELQAAVLRVKLRALAEENARRRHLASLYDAALANTSLVLPQTWPDVLHVFHQYVVRCERRDELRAALRQQGIGSLVHYPVAIHQQPAYRNRIPVYRDSLPNTEVAASQVLSLPMYPQLTDEQITMIADVVQRSVQDFAD